MLPSAMDVWRVDYRSYIICTMNIISIGISSKKSIFIVLMTSHIAATTPVIETVLKKL